MPSLVTSAAAEKTVRAYLRKQGYSLTAARKNGETGVDILATRGDESIHVEVIAFKSSGPARARDFFQAFFRAISRTDQGATRSVIALPSRWKNGLPMRAKQYGTAWSRLGKAFPELEIWCVDCDSGGCQITKWNDWLSNDAVRTQSTLP